MLHRGEIVFDVSGTGRRGMKVEDLLNLFRRDMDDSVAVSLALQSESR
jgi:ABC-type uncharacterized transport system ATPase component